MSNSTASVLAKVAFDYSALAPELADRVRQRTENIKIAVRKSLDTIIEIGRELIEVKSCLKHGEWGSWLQAEFGWTQRTAEKFISVAEYFGLKIEIISDLKIQPTAAYLLSAPSVPDSARQIAIDRAVGGECITVATAKQIVVETKKKSDSDEQGGWSMTKMTKRLIQILDSCRGKCDPRERAELATWLRTYAGSLEQTKEEKEAVAK